MGKRISLCLMTIVLIFGLLAPSCFATETKIDASKQRITVQDRVPEFTIYCEETGSADLENGKVDVEMYSGETEIINTVSDVSKFDGEGITYFLLIDTSKSMDKYSDESFDSVKKAIINFANNALDSKDKVFILPFSEKGNYENENGINPTTTELKTEINALEANGNKSNIYDALAETVKIAERIEGDTEYPDRKVALIFTDACEFNDGGDEATSSDVEMVSAGVTLHAFTVGTNKQAKNDLKDFVTRSGGRVFDGNIGEDLITLHNILEESIVIKTTIKNPSDLVGTYSVKVFEGSFLVGQKDNISAPNTEGVKDAGSVVAKKFVKQYWWIILIIAIAIIVIIALAVIKRNKGVVNVDGKVVYGNNVQQRYHVKVKDAVSKDIQMRVSVKGSETVVQEVSLVESLIVGRANMCDLYFDDEKMSRQHFAIEIIDDQLYISDLDSTSGTYLNGIKVYMKQKLCPGDIITAGTTKIVIDWQA